MPPAGNWVCFSCSIPPLFVLNHSLPMVNTMGKLALFGRFSITASLMSSISLATGSWLMTTSHAFTPHATRATYRRDQRGQAVRRPSRWLLHATDRRIGKDRTGPDLDERPHYIHYVTDAGNFFEQINPFLPARRRPTVDHSLVAGGAQRHFPCLRATMPPSLETMRGNWKNQFSNLSSLDTSCRSPLILVMRSSGTGVFPPSSIRT